MDNPQPGPDQRVRLAVARGEEVLGVIELSDRELRRFTQYAEVNRRSLVDMLKMAFDFSMESDFKEILIQTPQAVTFEDEFDRAAADGETERN